MILFANYIIFEGSVFEQHPSATPWVCLNKTWIDAFLRKIAAVFGQTITIFWIEGVCGVVVSMCVLALLPY